LKKKGKNLSLFFLVEVRSCSTVTKENKRRKKLLKLQWILLIPMPSLSADREQNSSWESNLNLIHQEQPSLTIVHQPTLAQPALL
jgi:hypothetical protein